MLHRELARNPHFFVEVVSWVFKSQDQDEEPREVSEEEAARAAKGYELLHSWREVPGRKDDGSVEAVALASWIGEARKALAAGGRAAIGDQYIGRVLRYGPNDADNVWPDVVIRDVIEEVASEDLETGLEVEVRNSRGVTSRGLTDGGVQERKFVERYLGYAQAVTDEWPRTAAMLHRLAKLFEADARREDVTAELTEDMLR